MVSNMKKQRISKKNNWTQTKGDADTKKNKSRYIRNRQAPIHLKVSVQ